MLSTQGSQVDEAAFVAWWHTVATAADKRQAAYGIPLSSTHLVHLAATDPDAQVRACLVSRRELPLDQAKALISDEKRATVLVTAASRKLDRESIEVLLDKNLPSVDCELIYEHTSNELLNYPDLLVRTCLSVLDVKRKSEWVRDYLIMALLMVPPEYYDRFDSRQVAELVYKSCGPKASQLQKMLRFHPTWGSLWDDLVQQASKPRHKEIMATVARDYRDQLTCSPASLSILDKWISTLFALDSNSAVRYLDQVRTWNSTLDDLYLRLGSTVAYLGASPSVVAGPLLDAVSVHKNGKDYLLDFLQERSLESPQVYMALLEEYATRTTTPDELGNLIYAIRSRCPQFVARYAAGVSDRFCPAWAWGDLAHSPWAAGNPWEVPVRLLVEDPAAPAWTWLFQRISSLAEVDSNAWTVAEKLTEHWSGTAGQLVDAVAESLHVSK